MLDNTILIIAFGPFQLFPAERRLERDGNAVRLGGRALDLLIALVTHAGEVVPNQSLVKDVWGDVHVEESSLRFHIKNSAQTPRRHASGYEVCHQRAGPWLLLRRPGGSDLECGKASL